MKVVAIRRIRPWTVGLGIALVGSSFGSSAAQAQANFFSGFTNGCFYLQGSAACAPASSPGSSQQSTGALSYEGSSFEGTLTEGSVDLDFGSFHLGESWFDNLFDDQFVLRTTFAGPENFSQLFFADILGLVVFNQGYAYLNFSDSPTAFGENNEYNLWFNDVQLGQGIGNHVAPETGHLVGRVTLNQPAQVTPEPVSMLLLGSGLAGIAAVKRRRRRQEETAA